jgi:hypothetical protein
MSLWPAEGHGVRADMLGMLIVAGTPLEEGFIYLHFMREASSEDVLQCFHAEVQGSQALEM